MADASMDELIALLLELSFRRGDFTLASGQRSSFYVDARRTTMSGRGQLLIGRLGLHAIDAAGWTPDAVGGLTMGADPVAYAIAHAAALEGRALDGFSVRKQPKGHGAGRQVEGPVESGASVVVVEDVVTTGGSALQAIDALESSGIQVVGVLAVVDRDDGGADRIRGAGYPMRALVPLAALTEAAGSATEIG